MRGLFKGVDAQQNPFRISVRRVTKMAVDEITEVPAVDSQQPDGFSNALLETRGVRELLKNFEVTEIPEYYIKPESMREQSETVVRSDFSQNLLPVIDMALPREDLVKEIGKACEAGFFQLINHGTDPDLLRRITTEAEAFFSLPVEEKIVCSTAEKVAGPIHFGGGSRGDWRDILKIHLAPPAEVDVDHWPVRPDGFRETLVHYVAEQQLLVRKLLAIISETLGLDNDYIDKECGDPRMLLAINHYPPCPDPSLTMGIRAHTDPNTLTVLLQNQVPGLQVFKDGLWFDVKPLEDALIVNVGDHLQIVSNGKYPSCQHRVTNNKTKSRTSFALFFSPAMIAHIKPAPALVDEEHPSKYREFVYGSFLKSFYRNGGLNNKVVLSQFKAPEA